MAIGLLTTLTATALVAGALAAPAMAQDTPPADADPRAELRDSVYRFLTDGQPAASEAVTGGLAALADCVANRLEHLPDDVLRSVVDAGYPANHDGWNHLAERYPDLVHAPRDCEPSIDRAEPAAEDPLQDVAAGCGDMPAPPVCIEQAPVAENRNAEIECRDAMVRFGEAIRDRVTCLAAEQQRTSQVYQDALQRLNCRASGDC